MTFKPVYKISETILHHLTTIAASAMTVENAPLIPKWELSIRREALLRNAHASTAIEGNPLSLEQVSDLAAGREIMVNRKAKAEVLNYLSVLGDIPVLAKKRFSEKLILNVHKRLTRDVLDRPVDSGVYRTTQVVVGNRFTGEISFRPPRAHDVPTLMHAFVVWLSRPEKQRNPILEAGISHYELVRIHPFIDGNGRTARALASLILYNRGFDTKRFFALDDYYDGDRSAYYKALQSVDPKSLDVTTWLEYFTRGVMLQIEQVKQRVIGLSMDVQKKKEFGQIALTERQMRIIEALNNKQKITISEIAKLFNFTRQAALKEVAKLVTLNVIALVGTGRGAYYVRK